MSAQSSNGPPASSDDDRIEALQDQIFENPEESQLAALFELKRQLVHTTT